MIMGSGVNGYEGDVKGGGKVVTNLRYADDVVLIASTLPKLQELVDRGNEESKKHGLSLNAGKTKVRKVLRQAADDEDDQHIRINGTEIKNVTQFTYLGATFTNTYDDTPEIKRRIAIA